MSTEPERHRLRWIDLVAVVAICAVLIGLLLSAIPQVRVSDGAMRCKNLLLDISLATLNFDSTNGRLPSATVPNPDLAPNDRLSWYVQLLPYLEQTHLEGRIDLKKRWDEEPNAAVANEPIRYLQCASWDPPDIPNGSALTPYLGMAGVGEDAATLPVTDARAGIFAHDRKTTVSKVKDGLSNTLLVVETASDPGPWIRGGPSTVRVVIPGSTPFVGEGRPFGGIHHGRALVAMADGSARSVRDDLRPEMWLALATINGQEGAIHEEW